MNSLSVRNYRCFEELTDLPIASITAFTGPNDSGKSSLLHLLRHCFLNDALLEADFRDPLLPIVVEMAFIVKRASEAANAQDFMLSERELLVRKEFEPRSKPVTKVYRQCYEEDRLNRLNSLSMAELIRLLGDLGIEGRFGTNDERRLAICEAIETNPPAQHNAWVDADAQIASVLPEYILFGADEDLTLQAGPLVMTLRQVYRRFLEQQPEEITQLLSQAKEELQREIEGLNPVIQEFAPDGSTLVIDPQLDISNSLNLGEIQVKKADGEVLSFGRCGDGTKRRIMLGVFHWANDVLGKIAEEEGRSLLWGFDEPDTHLHYEAQYELLGRLRGMTVGPMQILVCTHSIPIIDRLPTHVVRHMIPDRMSGCTAVEYVEGGEDVTAFLRSVGHGLGFPNSLLFYERCFILVEGPTEEKALPILYQKVHGNGLFDDGIRLFAAESDGAVLQLARLLHRQGREVIVLLDSDTSGKHDAAVDRLQEVGFDVSARIVYTGDREFEDAFSDEAIAGCLNAHYARTDGRLWCEADVLQFRSNGGSDFRKFSHDFLEVEVGRKARMRVTKPEFGRKLAEHVAPASIPAKVLEVFDIARRVANP